MTDAATEPGIAAAAPPDAPPRAPDEQALDPRRWSALAVVLTATFMVLLDISIVNVAIPSIQNNLHASFAQVQFVLAGYALAYAVFLITGGRLGDIYGRRRLFMIGMAGFTVASALCGLAQSPEMLIGSRVLQGFMAALMYPQVLSVIQVSFAPRERAKAFGIFGATIGMAAITGPLMGGLIIRDDVTGNAWRFVFLVNVPIGIVSLLAAYRLLQESRAPHASKLDIPGVFLVTAGMFCLVFPLVQGRELGWPAWAFGMMALSPLVFGTFVVVERRIAAAGGSPLIRLALFSNRAFTLGALGSCLFIAGVPAFFFTIGLTMQIGLGFSPLRAGLTTFPFALASAIASTVSVRLAPRLGNRILYVGCALLVVGMASLALTLHWRGNALNGFDMAPALFINGLGLGAFIAPVLNIVLARVEGRDAGAASGVLTTLQQIGGAMGVAVIGVIFFGLLSSRAPQSADGVTAQLRAGLAAAQPGAPAAGVDAQVATFRDCFVRRVQSADPSETPSGCPAPPSNPTTPTQLAFATAAKDGLGTTFSSSMQLTLVYEIVVFGLTGLLCVLLPSVRRERAAPAAGV